MLHVDVSSNQVKEFKTANVKNACCISFWREGCHLKLSINIFWTSDSCSYKMDEGSLHFILNPHRKRLVNCNTQDYYFSQGIGGWLRKTLSRPRTGCKTQVSSNGDPKVLCKNTSIIA